MKLFFAAALLAVMICGSNCIKKDNCIADIKNKSYTQHCSSCGPPDNVKLNLTKLTVGNDKNQVHDGNIGQVCIKGTAKFPMGFMKATDTLDLRLRVTATLLKTINIQIPCGIIHNYAEAKLFPERFDEEGEKIVGQTTTAPNGDKKWMSEAFSHFDYNTCIVSDLCGLLKPGEGLRSKVDEMMTNSTEEELGGLGEVFANYSSNDQKNACSVDFFNAQSKSLDDCYPLPNFDLSALKDITGGKKTLDAELVIEMWKRDTAAKDQPKQNLLCLFMPLHVVFS
ncbi:uncharacterized protein LOC142336893 [Convolutriloba macropyga]|uniref:uncharacterized protein LOC142336893 n=1 Tax=Convolutriloba macropyga TaxID=536237 RepID=UPI003F51ED5A